MSRWVHLSDLHFGTVSTSMTEHLLAQVNALKPDLVVISGDLTQRAKSQEFQAARAFIHQLPQPHLVVPGNHDLAAWRVHERLIYPWQKWRRYISRNLEPVVSGPDFVAVGINTARRTARHLDWSRGRIDTQQIQHIKRCFAQVTSQQLCVLVAHHPFYLSESARSRGLVGGFKKAWPALQQAGVNLILGGHLHLAYAQVHAGIIVAQAGSGLSHRLKGENNSFNLIEVQGAAVSISQLTWEGQRFSQGRQQTFMRRSTGFVEVQSAI